ncbi:hypothetical protein OHA37_25580 [Streptomyces sp. NBC_00335]|uniref:hypothetical protein n=1 Tax=unclassified Streptomyces TaxID=2593676 RepID=UPI0022504D22|nr:MULTISPECIES: hypothetical protein [unclassified Streptomyces]MCX5407226.1 hypothetical protein [Streptomyces sp. NBC_00086]
MKWLATIFAALGGVLPIAAVLWGWRSTRREYKRLVSDLDAIDAVIHAPEGTYPDMTAQSDAMKAIRAPHFTYGRTMYTYEWIQRLILEQAMSELRGPAWLAGAGIAFGTAASVWSTWL